jgi:hypothetical protein
VALENVYGFSEETLKCVQRPKYFLENNIGMILRKLGLRFLELNWIKVGCNDEIF